MENQASISIYNASAGAGKTFTLVRNYLIILFKSPNDFKYRRILAITFTNKAVAEMKLRIVENLQQFTTEAIFESPSPMLLAIEEETQLTREEIQQKAKRLLKNIIQDFASFDVVTIDTFTHRIIRTFAYDLKIPQNFEVELNTQDVLEQAVDRLIDQAGRDEQITSVLLDYALEKTDNDKSWDITRDFYEVSKLLLNENDYDYLQLLKEKDLSDFAKLKRFLTTKISSLEQHISTAAKDLLKFIASQGLEESHFKGKYLPKTLYKIAEGIHVINTKSAWVQNLGQEPLYTKTQKESIKALLDAAAPELTNQFNTIKNEILQVGFYKEIHKKITQLSVLQAINQEVQKIKSENNLVLISDFNKLIHKSIANQPTPFIYERLGERYENYFIDEFQDTSKLQWQNLIPLIENAVSINASEDLLNSLMLVGDPKQAIYRWRGGEADQFISLSADANPFQNNNKEVIDLPRNYRSYSEIINFNNSFFSELAPVFDNSEYQRIYEQGNAQEVNSRDGGYVSISFVEGNTNDELTPLYLEKVVETVNSCRERGFELQEICILVRKNSEGIQIAQKLQEADIPVISNESLLLKQAPQVAFIVDILHYTLEDESNAIALNILEYLASQYFKIADEHEFFQKNIKYKGQELFDHVFTGTKRFDFQTCTSLPLYEAVEYIIRSFDLQLKGGAYIQFFLDAVYDFSQKNSGGLPEFIIWWERKKDKLSISTPSQAQAVQIMTIHKSKGLEFPVVIYPFAHSDIYPRYSDNYNWYLPEKDEFLGFEAVLIGQKSEMEEYNDQTAALYHIKRSEQQLDNINILYVALTRSIEQLHIISKVSKKPENSTNFSDLLYNYAKQQPEFDESQHTFKRGNANRISSLKVRENKSVNLSITSTAKEEHNLLMVTQGKELWNTERKQAITYGNIIHALMAEIYYPSDVEPVLKKALSKGLMEVKEYNDLGALLKNLIEGLKAEGFFSEKNRILNERDIQISDRIIRPDRIEIFNSNELLLLDYKTGLADDSHKQQLEFYSKNLEKMGFSVKKKVLVYLNQDSELCIF